MPAEAVHLSALSDSLPGTSAQSLLRRHPAEARMGAIFVDLPYFDHFALGVLRYLLHRPVASSSWGARFHLSQPVALGKALLRRSAALREERTTHVLAEQLLSFALGYFSHLAVDSAIHPLVNRLANTRAQRLGDRRERQHTEVEKFQSILFHEQRLGFDFMGRPELAAYIGVDGALLLAGPLLREVTGAIAETLGPPPSTRLVRRWLRGYQQYTWLISGPVGKIILPRAAKETVRTESFDDCQFMDHFTAAVARSRRYIEAALAHGEAPSTATTAALDAAAPEGPIDDP